MNLYDQLLSLQVMPNAYEEWTDYRNHLTDYILGHLDPDEQVAIMGVGPSNDIDIARIAKHVKQLTLWDKDGGALQKALCQYQLENEEKIVCIEKDILGLQQAAYREYANRLIQVVRQQGMHTSMSVLVEMAKTEIHRLMCQVEWSEFGSQRYDTIIVIGLHSQLLSMVEWIWQVILQTLGQEESTVREIIMDWNQILIKTFHDKLIGITTKQIITGCELRRIGREGTIQWAVQGLENLLWQRQQGNLYKKSDCLLEWPFNPSQHVSYHMLIQVDQVTKGSV